MQSKCLTNLGFIGENFFTFEKVGSVFAVVYLPARQHKPQLHSFVYQDMGFCYFQPRATDLLPDLSKPSALSDVFGYIAKRRINFYQ